MSRDDVLYVLEPARLRGVAADFSGGDDGAADAPRLDQPSVLSGSEKSPACKEAGLHCVHHGSNSEVPTALLSGGWHFRRNS